MLAKSLIRINATEKKIFNTLENVVSTDPYLRGTTELRVAGGWVRDKLLGIDSDDIDISINNMTGKKFATILKSQLNADSGNVPESYVVKLNPEKSKHLETAAVKVDNVWIDFVHLRGEVYTSEGGRIPTTTFATPEEDVRRRDFTVNSLFYNIQTKSIEDFSGFGVVDLKEKVIRTTPPRTASEVLLEDPLRAYRAVRFATTLNFSIADDLKYALIDPQVHRAVLKKVSRERITMELGKMLHLRKTDALRGLNMLREYKLGGILFGDSDDHTIEAQEYHHGIFDTVCSEAEFVISFLPIDSNGVIRDMFSLVFSSYISNRMKHQDKDIFLRKISNQSNALSAEKPSLDFPYGRFLTSKTSASTGANIYIDLSNKSSAYFTSLNKKYNFEAYLSDKFRGMHKRHTKKAVNVYKASLVFPTTALRKYVEENNILQAKLVFSLWLCTVRSLLENEYDLDGTVFQSICVATLSSLRGSNSDYDMKKANEYVRSFLDFYEIHNIKCLTTVDSNIKGREIVEYATKMMPEQAATGKKNKKAKHQMLSPKSYVRVMKESLATWTVVNNVLRSEGLVKDTDFTSDADAYEFLGNVFSALLADSKDSQM